MKTFKTPQGTELQLIGLKGKDYLPVAQRLIWFREICPTWSIKTQLLEHSEAATLARAEILDETGRVMSTAHKTETAKGFADHTEKAETGAIGRALALCGFGTQFVGDELDEGERLADAPIDNTMHGSSVKSPQVTLLPPDEESLSALAQEKITFGKHKDRRFADLPYEDLKKYVWGLEQMGKESGKPLMGAAARMVEKAHAYLRAAK